jgi:hypothetical protein
MLVECQKCGAPLDVKASERFVKCAYCGTSTRLQGTRTLAMQTPPGWTPPPTWTPPVNTQLPQTPLAYRRQSARFMGCYVVFFSIWVIVAGAIPFIASNGIDLPFIGKVARWDKASTLSCSVNEELVLEDLTARVPFGPVVETSPNCRIVIRRCRLEGSTIVRGSVNTVVIVEDSQLVASDEAINGDANLEVSLRGQTSVEAMTAVRGSVGTRVDIDGPVVVSGRSSAIEGDTNLALHVNGGRLVAGGTAIRGGMNPEIRLTGATVEGGEKAWDLGMNARVVLLSSTVTGERVSGTNATIEER